MYSFPGKTNFKKKILTFFRTVMKVHFYKIDPDKKTNQL